MNNKKQESLSDNLAITVAETGSLELPAEILEFTIDQVMDDGILKDIPVVGWIAKGVSITRSISDRILHHKILRFLIELEVIGEGDREAFRTKIRNEPDFRKKVGEHLLILLDKIDAFDKTTLLAKCFDHFLTGDIEYMYFLDLSHVIGSSQLSDLNALCVPDNQRILFGSTGVAVACGILEYGMADPDVGETLPTLGTRMSPYGKDLRDIFLGRYRERLAQEKEQRERMKKLYKSKNTKNG